MNTPQPKTLRTAQIEDETRLEAFLRAQYYVHRHLDWRPALGWLGKQPFWLLERADQILGALACPPDPEKVYWVRLFGAAASIPPGEAWRELFSHTLGYLPADEPHPVIAAIALQRWFAEILPLNGFAHHQDIVVLTWNDKMPAHHDLPDGVSIRKLLPADLPEVARLDNCAFEPIWRNSLEALRLAYHQAAYATVAEQAGEIIGYQLSTSSAVTTHLARLAVSPDLQRSGVAFNLVTDLIDFHRRQGSWQLTVNTQHNNHASLALYQRLGFEITGERFPVFLFDKTL